MKRLFASVVLMVPVWAVSIAPASAQTTPTATTKTTAVKKTTKKAEAVKKTTSRPANARKAAAGAAGAAAAATVLAPRALQADELALAERVFTGRIACELGQFVNVAKDPNHAGHFLVSGNGFSFHMAPVGTSTGVVRLEDTGAGAVWLQIANKSMLMNQKQGKRLADDCMSPEQLQVAESIKKAPPQSLLDTPAP